MLDWICLKLNFLKLTFAENVIGNNKIHVLSPSCMYYNVHDVLNNVHVTM